MFFLIVNNSIKVLHGDAAAFHFETADTEKNLWLVQQDKADDRMLVYRTKGTCWGKERTVVVMYSPVTARKQSSTLESKLETYSGRNSLACGQRFETRKLSGANQSWYGSGTCGSVNVFMSPATSTTWVLYNGSSLKLLSKILINSCQRF